MQKIKIRLPATVTNLGPGFHGLGLAITLYTTVEISGRSDDKLQIEFKGEGANHYISDFSNPVVIAMSRVFQQLECAQTGINIRIENQIPLESGLGAESAMTVAGVIGANDLMGNVFKRDQSLTIAGQILPPDGIVASLFGGLTASTLDKDQLIYRTLSIDPLQIIVVVPEIDHYTPPMFPEMISRRDSIGTLERVPFLIEALRTGDLDLLVHILDEKLSRNYYAERITGYGHVTEIARHSGALAVTVCGEGPALLAFAESGHERISEDMVLAFKNSGVSARRWVTSIDTQGVVISAVQSA
jgi:homoserine kinase